MVPQIQKRLAEVMAILRFERMPAFHGISISLLEELQPAREFRIFLVIEVIDVLNISVEIVEKPYIYPDRHALDQECRDHEI
jgi:hypothetical protein